MTLKPRALILYGPAHSGMVVTNVEGTISLCQAITVRFGGSEHLSVAMTDVGRQRRAGR